MSPSDRVVSALARVLRSAADRPRAPEADTSDPAWSDGVLALAGEHEFDALAGLPAEEWTDWPIWSVTADEV